MNILQSPPNKLTINGTDYPINTDYRTWIKLYCMLDECDEQDFENVFTKIQSMIFGEQINEPTEDIINAVIQFSMGYPLKASTYKGNDDENNKSNGGQTPLFSFCYDINYIIIAIRNQSGIDLSYRRKEPFHFWDFLLEFQTLEEHHMISKIMYYRGYEGDNTEILKLKSLYALPERLSAEECEELKQMNSMFYNC